MVERGLLVPEQVAATRGRDGTEVVTRTRTEGVLSPRRVHRTERT